MRRLNFGCGSIQPPDWDNFDRDEQYGARQLLPQYDAIVAHCVIQQTPYDDLPDIMQFLYSLLAPGGVLRVSLPDIVAGFQAYERGAIEWFPNGEHYLDDRFSHWLTWYGTSKTLLTKASALGLFLNAGFVDVEVSSFGAGPWSGLDSRCGEVFFVEGTR